jgi:hypothetical protein
MTRFRSFVLTFGFAVVVAGTVAGTSFRGETREMSVAETCARAAWPEIPAGCLDGGKGHDVRTVTANAPVMDAAMSARFDTAFN